MKKLMLVYCALILTFLLYVVFFQFGQPDNPWDQVRSDEGLSGTVDEKYVMVTFQAGIDYWKAVLKGFEDAAQNVNVSVTYRGAARHSVNEQITVLEQVIARKPAGIALSAIDPKALTVTIDKAVDAGIPVVLFDSGAPQSKAYATLATNNYNAGVKAAEQMAHLLNEEGNVAVVTHSNQLNHQERTQGFRETMANDSRMQVVDVVDGEGDALKSERAAHRLMDRFPDLKGIFATEANGGVGIGNALKKQGRVGDIKIISFDTDKGTLDMVKDGTISATLAQGTWNMGYWSLMYLFHLKHQKTKLSGNQHASPLLPPKVDTGITVVTRENVDHFYAK